MADSTEEHNARQAFAVFANIPEEKVAALETEIRHYRKILGVMYEAISPSAPIVAIIATGQFLAAFFSYLEPVEARDQLLARFQHVLPREVARMLEASRLEKQADDLLKQPTNGDVQ